MRRALFVDRDGVVNDLVYYEMPSREWEAPRRVEDVRIKPGVREALRRAADGGWLLFLITNQPSYAKGKVDKESLEAAHEAIVAELAVPIRASYLCFHHPAAVVAELRTTCRCRKPGPEFLERAARDYDVDLRASWMIGDQDSDAGCGRAAGCRVALVETPESASKRGSGDADLRVATLPEAIDRIMGLA